MVAIISCGEFNIYSKYIMLSILFQIINACLSGLNYDDTLKNTFIIFRTMGQTDLTKHYYIHLAFNYIGQFFLAFIFIRDENNFIINKKLKQSLKNPSEKDKVRQSSQILLIHNDYENLNNEKYLKSKESYYGFLTIMFLWIVIEFGLEIYNNILKDLDFWILELLIVTILNAKMFKLEVYNHQKFSIFFTIFPSILKISTIVIWLKSKDMNRLYEFFPWLIPLGNIIYLILIFLRSYINSKLKWYMDLKYFSTRKVLIYNGIMGTIVYTIVCIISTFIKCNPIDTDKNNNNNNKNFITKICKVNITNDYYFENFELYFHIFDLSGIWVELIVIFLHIISYFFYKYYLILIIKYLTPVHVIFSIPILYFFEKLIIIIQVIIEKINTNEIFDIEESSIKYYIINFILDFFGDILTFFGFLVYLEIIELNFCNLYYNLRKNIMKRGLYEIYENENTDTSFCNDTTDDEEEDSDDSDNRSLIVNTI